MGCGRGRDVAGSARGSCGRPKTPRYACPLGLCPSPTSACGGGSGASQIAAAAKTTSKPWGGRGGQREPWLLPVVEVGPKGSSLRLGLGWVSRV